MEEYTQEDIPSLRELKYYYRLDTAFPIEDIYGNIIGYNRNGQIFDEAMEPVNPNDDW